MLLENKLYLPLTDGGDHENWLLYRIADGSNGKKPFDIGGCDPYGVAVGLEVKVTGERATDVGGHPLPWGLFEIHQRWWLREYARQRALALVGLYYDSTKEMRIYRLTGDDDELPRHLYEAGPLSRHEAVYRGWNQLDIPRGKFGVVRGGKCYRGARVEPRRTARGLRR